MMYRKYTGLFLFILLLSSCQPQGYPEQKEAEWVGGIFLKQGAKNELSRYFRKLEAEHILIESDISYDEDNDKESLTVRIKGSKFLFEKSILGKEIVLERLAFLIFSRLMYPYSFQDISFIEYGNKGLDGDEYEDTFYRSFSPEQFELPVEESLGEDYDLEEDYEETLEEDTDP